MVGKNKAQRTKNNARPSSSGRSAELLSSQLTSLKDIGFLSPLMKNEEFDPSVNSDFQIVFKRMNKKDSTTKLKALQEFSDLIKNSEAEAIKLILNFWCRIYVSLAIDIDHRIREAVQCAHYQIILKDKKMLASIIKQIIGAWFTSQYDTYPPAATIACKSFQTTFPDEKVQNCLLFCHKEILSFIKENLIEFSNYTGKFNEEDEAKLERMILSSLQGYCMYLEVLTSEQIDKQIELNQDIIRMLLTHKYLKHKLPLIRSSCYQVITRVYQKSSSLLDNKQIINCIVDNLDDNDPTVIPFIWETFILIVDIVENWSSFLNNYDKQFLNKLWNILQKGGQGCANIIYPNFLMLLTKLPPMKDLSFYDRFFENLRQGLDQRGVKFSKSESSTIVVTIIECMRYVILTQESNVNFCEKLIKRHLFAFLQHNFKENRIYNKTAIQEVTFLVQYWYRNQNEHKNYKQYLDYFKAILEKLFETSLNELETCNLDSIKDITEKHKLFVTTFKNPYEKWNKSSNRVKFALEEDSIEICKVTNESTVENLEFSKNLTDLVYLILKSYFKIIDNRQLTALIDDSVELIRLFDDNDDFLINLNNYLDDGGDRTDLCRLYDFVNKWLENLPEINQNLINFVFILYKHSNSDEKLKILQKLLNCKGDCLAWCVISAVSPQFSNDLLIKNWLLNREIGGYLLEIINESINNEWHPYLETILDSVTSDNALLIEPAVFLEVVAKLQEILNNFENYETTTVESVVNLTSFLLNRINHNETLTNTRQDLSLTLFSFICSQKITEILDGNTQRMIKASFLNCLDADKTTANYLQKISNILQEKFLNYQQQLEIDYFTTIIYDLLEFLQYNSSAFLVLFKFDLLEVWRAQLLKIGEYCKYLVEPNYQLMFNNFDEEIDFNNFAKYFSWSTLKLSIIHKIYENNQIHQIEMLIDWSEIICDFILLEILIHNYPMVKGYNLFKQNYNLMQNRVEIVKELAEDHDFVDGLIDEISKYSQLWSRIITAFCIDFIKIDKNKFKSPVRIENCKKVEEMFEKVEKIRERDTAKFLLENRNVSREEFQEIVEILRLFSDFMNQDLADFPVKRRYWDLVVICLTSWSTNCLKLQQNYKNIDLQTFIIGLSQLFVDLIKKLEIIKNNDDGRNFDLIDEWGNLFYVNVHNDFVRLWLKLTEYFEQNCADLLIYSPFLQEFGKIIQYFNYRLIFTNNNENLPNWTKFLKRSFALLTNQMVVLQLYGYQMLSILVDGLIEIDLNTIDTNTFSNCLCLEYFKDCLMKVDGIVNELLQGFRLCDDCCQVEPHTDSYTYIFAYLNLWNIFLQLCGKSSSELRYQYADWYRKNDILKHYLDNLFKLMPRDIFTYNYNSNNNNSNVSSSSSSENKLKLWRGLFEKSPNLSFNQLLTYKSDKLEHYSCWLYTLTLSQLPALVRQWWSETDSKISQIIERITTFYVSPRLCNDELTDVINHETKFKNMVIKVMPQVREVVAIYTVDDAQMELVITLPANYPLKGPDVHCNRQIGGTSHKQWLMQLKKCLLHQNGRIWDGLSLWNNNLDKKFDGIEECYICFAVLHPGTYQLPKLSCRTCKKKFHSACLYKWFSTSNKSTCPICRNLF